MVLHRLGISRRVTRKLDLLVPNGNDNCCNNLKRVICIASGRYNYYYGCARCCHSLWQHRVSQLAELTPLARVRKAAMPRSAGGGHTSSSELRHGSDALGKLVAWSGWQDTALKTEFFWYVHDYNLCL